MRNTTVLHVEILAKKKGSRTLRGKDVKDH